MKKIVLSAILCLLLTACSGKGQADGGVESYNYDNAVDGSLSDFFSEADITELQFSSQCSPASITGQSVYGDKVILIDSKRDLYIFSNDGTLQSCTTGKEWGAPGENRLFSGYLWNPHSNLIEIVTLDRMMFYDDDFNLIKEVALPEIKGGGETNRVVFTPVYDISDSLHVFLPDGGTEQNVYYVFNSRSGLMTDTIRYDNQVLAAHSMQTQDFFTMSDGTVICHPRVMTPFSYEFDPETLKLTEKIKFDMGREGLTQHDIDAHNGSPQQLARYIMQSDKDIPLRTLFLGDKMIIIVMHGETMRQFGAVIIDRRDGSMKKMDFFDNGRYVFPYLQCVDKEYAYTIMDKESLMADAGLIFNSQSLLEKLDSFADGSFVRIRYRISND